MPGILYQLCGFSKKILITLVDNINLDHLVQKYKIIILILLISEMFIQFQNFGTGGNCSDSVTRLRRILAKNGDEICLCVSEINHSIVRK